MTYCADCSFDWWNTAPSIGANGTHCVAYLPQVGPPPFITCPADVVTCTYPGLGSALVAFSVSATGVPAPVVTCTLGDSVITSPFAFPIGTHVVTCTATNTAGTNTCTFTVTVNLSTVDCGFNPGSSGGRHVLALAVQTDGKILVGGDFSTLGGQPRNMIGRLNSNGALDTSFNPGADNWVYALAVQEDGKILVGGFLTSLGELARDYLGRLNADGTLDTNFNPGANGQVLCFAVEADGKILVGGRFTTLGGQPRSRIGRLNPDGTLDPSFNPEPNFGVLSIALQPDGKIVVAGEFTMIGVQPRDRIAQLNDDGTLDPSFNQGANSTVQPMAVQADGKILVGGNFTILGGQPRNWIGRLNSNGTLDTNFNPGADNLVASFAVQADGKILAGGFFTTLGGQPRNYIGRLNADGTVDPSFNPGADLAGVYAMAEQADGKILLGGSFAMLGGQPRDHIARLNNTGPVTESLTYDGSAITWLRGGTGPEAWRTSFEHSTNGTTWTPLGAGARIQGGWQLTGVVLPSGGIRARGHVTGGYLNGSGWFVESLLSTAQPLITCPSNVLTGTAPGLCSALVAFSVPATGMPAPVVTCTLGGSVITSPFAFPVGVNAVTSTASNIAGVAHCTFTVTVVDTTPPVSVCNSNRLLERTSPAGAVATFAATATDACDANPVVVCSPASGSTFPLGATTVTCTATDTHTKRSSCTFTVTVVDTTPPAIVCNSNRVLECSSPAGAVATFAATATDACDANPVVVCSPTSGSAFPLGATLVNCTATDANANRSSCTFTVTVVDITPPVIVCNSNRVLECSGSAGAVATFTVTATDACDANPVVFCSPASGSTFRLGSTTVTCTATDANTNRSSCTFTVAVADTTPPIITCPPTVTVSADPGQCSRGNVIWTATATDNGDSGPAIRCAPPSGSTFPVGLTMVTCTAVDAAGNTNRCSFTVTVRDTEPPQIRCPTNITAEFMSTNGAAVSFEVSAIDTCAATGDVSCAPASGSTFPIGMTAVVCTVTDAASNLASCRFQVTVLGARGVKQQVQSELIALRVGVISRTDTDRLNGMIGFLTDALNPARWLDETHLLPKPGDQVFQKEKDAVNKLRDLVNDPRSTVPAATLHGFVGRLVKVDWLLAVVSVQEASAAGLNPKKIAEDLDEIAKGDADAAAGRAENAIEHYRNVWKHAVHLQVKGGVLASDGTVRLHFIAFPGDRYVLQASTNLVDWTTLATITANSDGVIDFEDADGAGYPTRFYRVVAP